MVHFLKMHPMRYCVNCSVGPTVQFFCWGEDGTYIIRYMYFMKGPIRTRISDSDMQHCITWSIGFVVLLLFERRSCLCIRSLLRLFRIQIRFIRIRIDLKSEYGYGSKQFHIQTFSLPCLQCSIDVLITPATVYCQNMVDW